MTEQRDAPEGGAAQPVAWRVKDFADSWILFNDEARAQRECQHTGALIQPLYLAPTPPAPSGLVDAVKGALAYLRVKFPADSWSEDQAKAWLDQCGKHATALLAAFDATLSGQQGGAVPAGDLPSRAGDVTLASNAIEAGFRWGLPHAPEQDAELEKATWDATHALLERLSRARLAEQPAPAGTGADGVEGLREKIARIADDYQPDRAADAPQALEEMREALRAALDAGSREDGL